MAGRYSNEQGWKERIIQDEIDRHAREYEKAQERYGWSVSKSPEETMRKHDVLGNALSVYLRSDKELKSKRTQLSDIRTVVERELKKVEDGFVVDAKPILYTIKGILNREA